MVDLHPTYQKAEDFNNRFALGRRFKVGEYPNTRVGTLHKEAFVFEPEGDSKICCWIKFNDEDIQRTLVADLSIAGYATVRFLKNPLNVKWAELERAGSAIAIIDSDDNDLLTKRVDPDGGCLYFTNSDLPSLRIHKMIIHPKGKEVSNG